MWFKNWAKTRYSILLVLSKDKKRADEKYKHCFYNSETVSFSSFAATISFFMISSCNASSGLSSDF